jgi:hypothetical protein
LRIKLKTVIEVIIIQGSAQTKDNNKEFYLFHQNNFFLEKTTNLPAASH